MKPLGSLNSLCSYAPQLSGAKSSFLFTLLLAFPQLLSGGQHPSAVSQLGELSFTFGGQESLMAVTFLVD